MIIKRRNWRTLAEPPHGKPVKILVWKNGDFESNEQEVTLHPKYLKSWNAVLAYLTGAVQPNFGAVRKMYHLESRKLVDCLKNLTTNERYIVAGREKARFKKNGYLTKQEKLDSDTIKSPANSIHLSDHVKSLLNFMEYTKRMKRTIIYVMVSGRTCQKPIKVVLTEADLLAWNKVLEYLAYQLDVAEGVQFLCKVNGKLIFHPEDLQHGELYVAMPFNGKFVQMDYVKLFSELRPPKKVKIRKPRKLGNISLIQTKKGKTRSQHRVASSSLAVLAGSVAVVHGKCFLPKCRTKECRLQEPTVRSSNVEVQTQFSDSGDDERNLSAVHILDTNLEAYEKHYQESKDSYVESENESLESPSENEFQDEVENRYFYDSMEIIKSILDELIDECLFELECKGKVSPQRKSLSKASVDKVFIADPAEKLSIESLDISTEHDDKTEVVIKEESFDCCTENAKQKKLEEKQKESKEEGDRILTTFAEIARRKQQENDKARLKKSTSRLSVESDLESGYKSVSFGSEELVQPTILEEKEPTELLAQTPKASILKLPPLEDIVATSNSQSDEESEEEKQRVQLYREILASPGFRRQTRDSIMVHAQRLSKLTLQENAVEEENTVSTGTQKFLADNGENDKSVQAFHDEEEKASTEVLGKKSVQVYEPSTNESRDLYNRGRDISDIYNNFDRSSTYIRVGLPDDNKIQGCSHINVKKSNISTKKISISEPDRAKYQKEKGTSVSGSKENVKLKKEKLSINSCCESKNNPNKQSLSESRNSGRSLDKIGLVCDRELCPTFACSDICIKLED